MRWFVVCFVVLLPSLGAAQPFGIVMGQQVEALQPEKTAHEFTFRVTPPKIHPEMDGYYVVATPGQGVCMVRGVGVHHANDGFGFKIKDVAAEVRQQVDATYGRPELYDYLRRGSMWGTASDWAFAISKDERVYQSVWGKKEGSTLPNNVVEVIEDVQAANVNTTFLVLQFQFSNYGACKKEMDGAAAKAF